MMLPILLVLQKFGRKWELSDRFSRSLVKTLTWRIAGSTSTFTIAYLITGSIGLSSGIAVVQMIVNTFLYWAHERIWNRIIWGRQ
jgi:uncharacterized membrane protein